ncbi:MAG: Outer membrane autotransporter barrel [Candidatus Giovannonibacteria bacterium GW2011_GWA2_44_13b]|uniref:Outer membrane autotransporter barrel n=2 Tax=Candidatus Giovannoniibacteriota TaxID=1752738 RepID=A0A0G1H2M9_9BACT|nr:MAG: Outer membrane autotransporter barrel [Candidatus Giovannonibacteria bacterium GW2011_GWA2_44_13b]OGF83166.1 MAG: hypothetical protein A2924_01785 [Candidatus Giovannonibacteria bacterium RIFCSPLOWO2_01_FULL_44_16]
MQKNQQKMNKLPTWKPGFQVTWRWHRQAGRAVKNCVKNTAVFLLILAWAFLPLSDYLILKIGDWKIALSPKVNRAFAGSQDFTAAATTTWAVPNGVTSITVKVWGAGGGSGGGGGNAVGGAGGGGGFVQDTISVTPGESLTVVVGSAGGAGQHDGGTTDGSGGGGGGHSAFKRNGTYLLIAGGGGGGGAGSEANEGGGAGGGGGTDTSQGVDGTTGSGTGPGDGGGGGTSIQGGGKGTGGGGTDGTDGNANTGGFGGDGTGGGLAGGAGGAIGSGGKGGLGAVEDHAGGAGGGGGRFGGGGGEEGAGGGAGGGGGGSGLCNDGACDNQAAGNGVIEGGAAIGGHNSARGAGGAAVGKQTSGNDGEAGQVLIEWADPINISGNIYTNEGITAAATGKTIKIRVGTSTPGIFSTTTTAAETDGFWGYAGIQTDIATGTPITVWVDNDPTFRAVTFTKASSTLPGASITGLNLYQNRVIVRHEGGDNTIINSGVTQSTSTTIADLVGYDGDGGTNGDDDIQFNANNGALSVKAGQMLYVWPGTEFKPGGAVTIHGGGIAGVAVDTDGSLKLAYGTPPTNGGVSTSSILSLNGNQLTLAGSFLASSTPSSIRGPIFTTTGTTTFNATTTITRNIIATSTPFYNLEFNGGGGSWSFNGNQASTTNNFAIITGTTTLPSTLLDIGGNFSNTGRIISTLGTTTFNGTTTQYLSGFMVGTSTLNNVEFSNTSNEGNGVVFSSNASTTNFFINSGTTTAPSLLSIAGNYSNSGTFTHNSGTVYLNGTVQQTLSGNMTGSAAFSNLTILNNSGTDAETDPGVIFAAVASTTGTFTAITPSTKIRFKAGATTTLQNMVLNGQAAGTEISLRAATSTTLAGTQELAPTTFSGTADVATVSAAMVDADSIVIAYEDTDASLGKYAIYNINGAQELAPTTFSGTADVATVSATMVDADSVAIAYRQADTLQGKYAVYNISGAQELTPTLFAPTTVDVSYVSATMVDADSVVIAYQDQTNTLGKYTVYNISGTEELAPTTFSGTANVAYVSAAMVDADSVVIAYRDVGASLGKYTVYNISGAEELAPTTFSGSADVAYTSAAMVDADSVIIAYEGGIIGKYAVYNINGAQELAPTTFSSVSNTQNISAAMVDADSVVIAYMVVGTIGKYTIYNINGAQELAPTTFSGASTVVGVSAAMADADSVVIAYDDDTNSLGKYVVYIAGGLDATWGLEVPGTASISRTDFMDTNACDDTNNLQATDGTNVDSGGNLCIDFTVAQTLTQSNYQWFINDGNIGTGGEKGSLNSSVTATDGSVARLRMNVLVGGSALSNQLFDLEYGTLVTSCGAVADWTALGAPDSGTIWRGYDNSTLSDGANLTPLLLPNSNVLETYEENGDTAAQPNSISVGERGEWDWVMQNNGATAGTTYCFQMVKDGSVDFTHGNYPQIVANTADTSKGGSNGSGGTAPSNEVPTTGGQNNQSGGLGGDDGGSSGEVPTPPPPGGGNQGGGGDTGFLPLLKFFAGPYYFIGDIFGILGYNP